MEKAPLSSGTASSRVLFGKVNGRIVREVMLVFEEQMATLCRIYNDRPLAVSFVDGLDNDV